MVYSLVPKLVFAELVEETPQTIMVRGVSIWS